ncbi:glycosyltransferase [Thermococcus sp. 2319x1]|uniref:glycosyltransferase n=1 Tax=Thermococcus sp. 2319x1 TaxID=1674923 RepID=UPI00158169D8|nr:glycosyltransferase [Thermococcus sp. 2319x1]
MNKLPVSLICTVKNEEESIRELLDSMLNQVALPDEIIIVDGGSTDNTVQIIREYIRRGAPIKLIVKEGANIAEGRNIAIRNSRNDIIASTDAGCVLDKNWIYEITKPLFEDPSVDVVIGWYEPLAATKFEEIAAELTYPKLKWVKKNLHKFLPSSRSVAFRKKCWERVGGYPEHLYTAEDTVFDIEMKEAGCNFVFNPKAFVYWKVRPSLRSLFKAHYLYAKGDAEAGLYFIPYLIMSILPFFITLLLIFLSVFYDSTMVFYLVLFLVAYVLFRAKKNEASISKVIVWFPLSLLVVLSIMVANTFGYFSGLISSLAKKKREAN